MSNSSEKFSMPPLLKGVLGFLGVSIATATAYLVTASGELILPWKLLSPIGTAFGALLLVWALWTYSLWKSDSKRERIKEAHKMGRKLCACSETGEILTLHHEVMNRVQVYCCPKCTRYDVIYPAGNIYIADDSEFIPPLPSNAHDAWLAQSRAQR